MLSADRRITSRELSLVAHPVLAGATIHKGAIVVLDTDGFARPGTAAAGLTVAGHADAGVNNATGDSGDISVTVTVSRAFRYDNDAVAPLDRGDIGSDAFILDDHTVSADATDRSRAGTVVDLDEDGVWIAFTPVTGT